MDFKDLPVYKEKERIIKALGENQTIIIESPTGSGKTTQLPLILKEASYDEKGIIGITQPRRIAALSISEFIKKQISDESNYCAYKMRFRDTTDKNTRIKIMTDGILLQEVKLDKTLSKYSVIMVDEAHERSLNIDFILGLLKEIAAYRTDLKIIISSATINTSVFSAFFDNAPIISIESRPFPVEVVYDPVPLYDESFLYCRKIASLVKGIYDEKKGDALVFLPGEAEIKDTVNELKSLPFSSHLEIYPLYGRLSKEEQEIVFKETGKGKMKVVVATNIAETSITIDKIKTVIDSGLGKVNFYNQKNFTSALIALPISRSSCDQRKGRAGRTSPGYCIRLYSEESYEKRPEYSEEEILRSDLAEVVLRMSELEIYNTETFPFITPPHPGSLSSAEETLISLGAIEKNHHLTNIGKLMIAFPLLPRLSRIIVEAILSYPDVMSDVLTAVSFLSSKSPYILPPGEELFARDRHKSLSDKKNGDFVSILTLFDKYKEIEGKTKKEEFCKFNYLDKEAMDEIAHIKEQLEEIISSMGIPIGKQRKTADYFSALIAGLRQYVCKKNDRFSYRSISANKIIIHPGSAWFSERSEYILAGEIVRTSKMYARTVSPVRQEWIKAIDENLFSLLNGKAEKKKTVKEKRKDEEDLLSKYESIKKGGKNIYLVPLQDAKTLTFKRGQRIYILCGKYKSKATVKMNGKGGEITLVPNIKAPLRDKINGSFTPRKREISEINALLDSLFMPYIGSKADFTFLTLREKGGKYSLITQESLETSTKETLYSLNLLLDDIPSSNNKLRKKVISIIRRISEKMDIEN